MSQANQIDGARESLIGNYKWVGQALNGTTMLDQVGPQKAAVISDILTAYTVSQHPDWSEAELKSLARQFMTVARMAIYVTEHWEERPKL